MGGLARNSIPRLRGACNVRRARSRLQRLLGVIACFTAVAWLTSSRPLDCNVGGAAAFLGGKRRILPRWPLLRYGGYELRQIDAFPFLAIHKVPSRPVSGFSISASANGSIDDFRGFPFSTENEASVGLAILRPTPGKLALSITDAVGQVDPEMGPDQQVIGVDYSQDIPGIGEVAGKLKSTGDWELGLTREVNALGKLRGVFDSERDWSVDLDKSYPSYGGFTPSVFYGAMQDGMHAKLTLDGQLDARALGSYSVHNEPGLYSLADLAHAGSLALSSDSGRHVVEAKGTYNEKGSGAAHSSLKYTANGRSASLEALMDSDQFRLALRGEPAEVSAAISREVDEAGNRPVDLEFKLARGIKVAARARLMDGKPRLRLSTGV